MGLDYKTVKELYDAQELLKACGHMTITKEGDRKYSTQGGYYESSIVYSQQEFVINPSRHTYREAETTRLLARYPEGVGRVYVRTPYKEYVSFNDSTGVLRFYLIPAGGLRIQRDGAGYKVMNPVRDYRITVDRVKAKEARKPAEDLLQFVSNLWDMIPEIMDYKQRPTYTPTKVPDINDRTTWHDYLNGMKNGRYDRYAKSTTMARLRAHFTQGDLAYQITEVPDTKVDHTEHWVQLDALRAAGMLEKFEGPVKKKRRKKSGGTIIREH